MLKKFIILFVFLSSPLFADPLTEAMNAYDQGDFKKAATVYEDLVKSGIQNGSVFYNLGNTYFRLGEKGKALAAYLAARRLLPRDPDIKANLKFAHEQMVDKLAVRSQDSILRNLAFWVDSTTPKELLFLSSLLICLPLVFIDSFAAHSHFLG